MNRENNRVNHKKERDEKRSTSRAPLSAIMMVRPIRFRMNEQTAVNNYYQKALAGKTAADVQQQALREFDDFVSKLRARDVAVIVVDDTAEPNTPDAIFPNNWGSFHADGMVGLYPMYAENRRRERTKGVLSLLQNQGFVVSNTIDLTRWEAEEKFLEGTGSLVLDRDNRLGYAALSARTHPDVIKDFEAQFGFKITSFTANQTLGGKRLPIYHTNVMMCVGDAFAVICLDTIDHSKERKEVVQTLEESGKEIIEISEQQLSHFAGNMLQVENKKGEKLIVMSAAAHASLHTAQKEKLLQYNTDRVYSSLDTIEALGGGSARCMMAEIFLPK